MQNSAWKLLDILNETNRFFASKGMDSPRLQAELLLADVLDLQRLDLYLQFERQLTPDEVGAYRSHVKKRLQRMPLQYITGKAGFRQLILEVSSEVLIPRPETEVLVEVVMEQLADVEAPLVLDLGCGSGAVAVSIAFEHRSARLIAVDAAPEAVAATRRNAMLHGVSERVAGVCGDLFAPLSGRGGLGCFAAIVSNPPYVPRQEIALLAPEVSQYEPYLALDGGEDGMDFYRRIAGEASFFLRPQGVLVLEMGDSQADAVQELLAGNHWLERIAVCPDLHGIPRIAIAHRSKEA